MANAVVYFDFDQYTLSSKSIQTLRSIAQVMEDNKDLEITVSGHADERGTREYNLALGQRRGEASPLLCPKARLYSRVPLSSA